MSFKSASIYAGFSIIALGALFYSDNARALIWIPSFFKQLLIVVLLIPIFTWFHKVEGFGRRTPRAGERGGSYGHMRIGTQIMLALFIVPITLIASPPVLWGSFDTKWGVFGIFVFCLGCYALALLRLARVSWDETAFRVTSPFHLGDRVFAWKTLSCIRYKRNSDYATLVFGDEGTARVGHYMEGYEDLMAQAESRKNHA